MAFRKLVSFPLCLTQVSSQQVHTTARSRSLKGWLKNFFENKPMPTEGALAVGYERIVIEAAKVGEDPLEVFNRDEKFLPEGAGTKADPYIIPSRNTRRVVMVQGCFMQLVVWVEDLSWHRGPSHIFSPIVFTKLENMQNGWKRNSAVHPAYFHQYDVNRAVESIGLSPTNSPIDGVMRAGEGKTGPPQCFWVTLDHGGRCPLTGDHFKLDYDPTDKWGIDELDLFKH